MRSSYFVVVGLLVTLSGCGGKSRAEGHRGNEGGSSNVGGAGAGGVGAAGAGVGGVGAGGVGAGGQPPECASFADAKPLSVPVLMRNDLTFAIHLGARTETCAETPLFTVQD